MAEEKPRRFGLPLFLFGFVGLGITCLEGIEPFVNFAKLISLLIDNWTALVRWPWLVMLELIDVKIPIAFVDGLNAVIFVLSFCLGFRRGEVFLYGAMPFVGRVVTWAADRKYFNWLSYVMVGGPFLLVYCVIFLSQPLAALLLLAVYFLISGRRSWQKKIGWFLVGRGQADDYFTRYDWYEIEETAPQSDENEGAETEESDDAPAHGLAISYMSWGLLVFMLAMLGLNLIAQHADTLLDLFGEVLCLAGIECAENG